MPTFKSRFSTCNFCSKEFEYYPSRSTGKFCSKKCYTDSKQRVIKCAFCSEFFKPKRKISKFCTKKCFGKYFSKNFSRENHSKWKGGTMTDTEGYIHRKAYDHPYRDKQNYVREHRLIMEKHIKRYLYSWEVIHHKNEIIDDNRLENLEIIHSNAEHSRRHKLGRPLPRNNEKKRWKGETLS